MRQATDVPLGDPLPKRKRFLAELSKSNTAKYNYPLKFQGRQQTYPVCPVEIGFPKYRLTNGRTQAAQEDYLAKHPELALDFFTDQESDRAQRAQHELLWELVVTTELLPYFKNPANSQEQPLILSADGFVVNGNRRLCAMRELYCEDRKTYGRYSHVDAIILPPCTSKDIDELEAYLQIQPDIKEDYSWVAKACMLRSRQQNHGYSNSQLSTIYSISEREIQAILERLALADEYLGGRGTPKQYELVKEDDNAFKQLHKARQQLKQEDKKDWFTNLSFFLIQNSGDVEGRLYQRIPEVRTHLDEITTRLADDLGVNLHSAPKMQEDDDGYEIFGVKDEILAGVDYQPLMRALVKSENQDDAIACVIDVIEERRDVERKRNRSNAALKQISEANARLRSALLSLRDGASREGIAEQLATIEKAIAELREVLDGDA